MDKKDFADYIYRRIQNDFLEQEGWKIELITRAEGQLLYNVSRKNETVVVSAIDKRALMYSDIDPMVDYRRKYDVARAIIYVSNDTSIIHTIKRYANVYGVEIQYTP